MLSWDSCLEKLILHPVILIQDAFGESIGYLEEKKKALCFYVGCILGYVYLLLYPSVSGFLSVLRKRCPSTNSRESVSVVAFSSRSSTKAFKMFFHLSCSISQRIIPYRMLLSFRLYVFARWKYYTRVCGAWFTSGVHLRWSQAQIILRRNDVEKNRVSEALSHSRETFLATGIIKRWPGTHQRTRTALFYFHSPPTSFPSCRYGKQRWKRRSVEPESKLSSFYFFLAVWQQMIVM